MKYAVGQTDLSDVAVTKDVVGGQLRVGAERTDGIVVGTAGGGLESLRVRVPEGVRVSELPVDDADVTVEDVAGNLTLSIDDGVAEVNSLGGSLRVDGDDAGVTVGAVDDLSAGLDDGTVTTTAETTLGDVSVDDGDLDLGVAGVDGDTTVRADNGTVRLRLSRTLDVTVVVRSDDASVEFEDGIFGAVRRDGERFRARIGDGNDRLTADVDDADVTVWSLS